MKKEIKIKILAAIAALCLIFYTASLIVKEELPIFTGIITGVMLGCMFIIFMLAFSRGKRK